MDAFECIFCMYGMNEDGVYGCFAEHPDGKPGESKGCVAHQAAGAIRLLQAENAKLRELVRRYGEYVDQDRCEGCAYKSRCDEGYIEECWQLTEIRELARELEMENGD
jgi:hypothetical protein